MWGNWVMSGNRQVEAYTPCTQPVYAFDAHTCIGGGRLAEADMCCTQPVYAFSAHACSMHSQCVERVQMSYLVWLKGTACDQSSPLIMKQQRNKIQPQAVVWNPPPSERNVPTVVAIPPDEDDDEPKAKRVAIGARPPDSAVPGQSSSSSSQGQQQVFRAIPEGPELSGDHAHKLYYWQGCTEDICGTMVSIAAGLWTISKSTH